MSDIKTENMWLMKVEEVGDDRLVALGPHHARQQHVEPFDDQNVGSVDRHRLAGHDVVDEMRIDRRDDMAPLPP